MKSRFWGSLHRPLRCESGIGLVEVAVAIVVLGIVLVGLFPLVVDSIRLSVQNAEVAQANRIVTTQIENLRENPVVLCTGIGVPAESIAGVPLPANEASTFAATQTISCVEAKLARVAVSVERLSTPGVVVASATTQVVTD